MKEQETGDLDGYIGTVEKETTYYKRNRGDTIWWIAYPDDYGTWDFTFDRDGGEIFNFYRDYPNKLSKKQKEIFDRENPFLKVMGRG